jgi:BlaI family transcriptional regulator, penicillinase repressor
MSTRSSSSSSSSRRGRGPIGRVELEILQHIQSCGEAVTVRQVAEHVSRTKGHVRTTVLNVMTRLVNKGYLVRRKREGVYEYLPRVPAQQLVRNLVHEFADRALGGSASPFIAYLAEDARLSAADVAQLRRLVDQLERGGGSGERRSGT